MNSSTIWNELSTLRPAAPAEIKAAEALISDLQADGHLKKTCLALLKLSDAAIAHFYSRLGELRSTQSPVSHQPNSGWMADADFCFINIRACGLGEKPGTFIQAAKLFPGLRTNALHLAPFTSYDFGVIYAVRSVRSLSPSLVDENLAQLGFSAGKQLRALVEAAHLLGKAVGFDLEPHTAQYSIPGAMNPELFRWLKLSPKRDTLDGGLSQEAMLSEPCQARLCAEIRSMTDSIIREYALDSLETSLDDLPAAGRTKERVFSVLISQFIAEGYWPLPSQVWSGDGLPAFAGYSSDGNYPLFRYLSRQGDDHGEQAYHILAPFRFNDGLLPNQVSTKPPVDYEPGIRFWSEIFHYWRDDFDFDFVRYDSVDHIFDSLWQGNPARAASDRPSPDVLRRCIKASQSGNKPYIGNLAERMGNELGDYANLGFDLILGNDMLQRIDRSLIEKTFWLYDELCALNQQRQARFSLPFCVDTHDTGNPHLWGEPLVKLMGVERLRLRHFVSRFAHAGLARRPKYEVMGAQDLSYGLYESNIREVNLNWVGDAAYNQQYHDLEDVYDTLRDFLAQAAITQRWVSDRSAWWVMTRTGNSNHLLAVVSLETGDGAAPETLQISIPANFPCQIHQQDFSGSRLPPVEFGGGTLLVSLPYLGFRLYSWG